MKYKLPNNRQQIKFLNILLNTKPTYNNGFIVNQDFFDMFKFSELQIIQILNALDDKKLIHITPPNEICPYPFIQIKQRTFSYIPEIRDTLFRFWVPLIISSGLSIAAIIISIVSLLLSLKLSSPPPTL